MGLLNWLFGGRQTGVIHAETLPSHDQKRQEASERCQPAVDILSDAPAAEPEEPLFQLGNQKVKLSERQAVMLIEIAAAAAQELSSVGNYSDDEVYELIEDIKGQMCGTPIELSQEPTKL